MNDAWRRVVEAGHAGDVATARAALTDDDPTVRELALGALARCGSLADADLAAALCDPAVGVRRRAAELAASRPRVELLGALADDDTTVVEMAAWAAGEQVEAARSEAAPRGEHADGDGDPTARPQEAVVARLVELATAAEAALVREAAVAALGVVGDDRGLPAILAGCADVPAVRRRAVLALAPFDGDDVEAAIERALTDRDWQVRQAAEDLLRASRSDP